MPTSTSGRAPSGWVRMSEDLQGVPVWKRHGERCYVATADMDQLLFIDAALTRFDLMSGQEFHTFVTPGAARR